MVAAWVGEHSDRLEALSVTSILDDDLPAAVPEVLALYDSLMLSGQEVLHNMSPAAASKILHQLVPSCFVMWDRNILPFAEDYGDFTLQMHRLGVRLVEESPYEVATMEDELQRILGYAVTKSVAKYLDEYNWYVMVGAARQQPR